MKNNKNNQFLQRGLIKNFASNGIVKWNKYQTEEFGTFDIKEIKESSNLLEREGLKAIEKIIQQVNSNKKIELTRKDLVTLKFFSCLNDVFKQTLDKENAEEVNSIILKYFDEFNKTGSTSNIQKDYYGSMEVNPFELEAEEPTGNEAEWDEWTKRNVTTKSTTLLNIWEKMESRLAIFKFDESKLMLQETMGFIKTNKNDNSKYLFMPITPNIGMMFYHEPMSSRDLVPSEKPLFFNNDIRTYRHETVYKNIEIIKQEQLKYIEEQQTKSIEEIDYHNEMFFLHEVKKYYDLEDLFIYDALKESAEVADMCNATALKHNAEQIIIYQNEKDIKNLK
ncbi:hypothetical protein [Mycoplasma todarodis]|uniref:hypothetical protein n=1 Tax=Mycoplasma todarodis TaxID=1937191 RepID=UPI003B2DD3FE